MERLKFNENDFNIHSDPNYTKLLIKHKAQAKFDEWYKQIENAPVVYGSIEGSKVVQLFGQLPGCNDTHTARLIDIQEIKKEPCKHKPAHYENDDEHINCKYCGVELIADWRAKE